MEDTFHPPVWAVSSPECADIGNSYFPSGQAGTGQSLQNSWEGPEKYNLPGENGPSQPLASFDGLLLGPTAQWGVMCHSWGDGRHRLRGPHPHRCGCSPASTHHVINTPKRVFHQWNCTHHSVVFLLRTSQLWNFSHEGCRFCLCVFHWLDS